MFIFFLITILGESSDFCGKDKTKNMYMVWSYRYNIYSSIIYISVIHITKQVIQILLIIFAIKLKVTSIWQVLETLRKVTSIKLSILTISPTKSMTGLFLPCRHYVELSIPRSVKKIGDYIFGNGGVINIRDE